MNLTKIAVVNLTTSNYNNEAISTNLHSSATCNVIYNFTDLLQLLYLQHLNKTIKEKYKLTSIKWSKQEKQDRQSKKTLGEICNQTLTEIS